MLSQTSEQRLRIHVGWCRFVHEKEQSKKRNEIINKFGTAIIPGFSFVVIFVFAGSLYEKISRPTFKNLSTEDFRTLALVVFGIVIADYFIIKRFLRTGEGNTHQD
jgi:hypothetical protein